MNNNRQQALVLRWLKAKSKLVQCWLRFAILLGLVSTLISVIQAWILAWLLQTLIVGKMTSTSIQGELIALAVSFLLRALVYYAREQVGFITGSILRRQIRAQVLDRLEFLGPNWISRKTTGNWSCMLIEQVEDIHGFYARYLPQIYLALCVPMIIIVVVFCINWAAGLIMLFTAPLIPLFMVLVGMGAAEANRRNFLALARLSSYFLDRLRGLETLRLFFRADIETENIRKATEEFRLRTMEVLRIAFLSSSVLEFFASISIAVVAVYFGLSYLDALHFGSYSMGVTLFNGFLVLILAPDFFQPLRDLGTFYHAQAKAVGAAAVLVDFLEHEQHEDNRRLYVGNNTMTVLGPVKLQASDLCVLTPDGITLAGPLNFSIEAGQRVGIVGNSGAGKSSLLSVLLGFLPYRGSLKINDHELSSLSPNLWRERLSWVSQNPTLSAATVRENILLGVPDADNERLMQAVADAYVAEFLDSLPDGLDSIVGEEAGNLSLGQAQRIVLARALIRSPCLLLLDEPTASLDALSERLMMQALEIASRRQTTLLVTHLPQIITDFDIIWFMRDGFLMQQQLSSTELVTSDCLPAATELITSSCSLEEL